MSCPAGDDCRFANSQGLKQVRELYNNSVSSSAKLIGFFDDWLQSAPFLRNLGQAPGTISGYTGF
jgi:hypothetical protein